MIMSSAAESTRQIQNWLKDDEANGIAYVASLIDGGLFLEIGTGMGRSAAIMALASPSSRIITIDNMTANAHLNMTEDEYTTMVYQEWESLGIEERINLRICDFRQFHLAKPIDLLFIEGKQTFKEALDCFNLFQKKLVIGGYVMIRDYLTRNEEHEHYKFVDEILLKKENYKVIIEGHFVYAKKIS